MDWVYLAPQDDEPTLFEGDGLRLPHVQPLGGADESSDECEYYGDEVDEVLLSGEQAFAHLAQRLRAAPVNGCAHGAPPPPAVRMARIRRELDELAAEAVGDTSDTSLNLDALRAQLAALEEARASASVRASAAALQQGGADVPAAAKSLAPAHLGDLQRRVAALEQVVGPSLGDAVGGRTVGELLGSVRDKLALVDDEQVGERLARDALRVGEALQAGGGADGELMQAGAVLARMDEWQHVAATLPTVVARLRCLKRVQDEAASLVRTVDALAERCDELGAASDDNAALLKDVRRTMDANLEVMLGNVRALEDRLDMVVKRKLPE